MYYNTVMQMGAPSVCPATSLYYQRVGSVYRVDTLDKGIQTPRRTEPKSGQISLCYLEQ